MDRLARLYRDRGIRLGLGLAVAVAIPTGLLFYFQFQSLEALGRSSSVVLTQLSEETADGLANTIIDSLKAPFMEGLLRTTQAQTEPLNLPFIQSAFEGALDRSSFVSRFYVWSDATDQYRGQVLAYDRREPDFEIDPPESAALVEKVKELAVQKRAPIVFTMTDEGREFYVQAQLRFTYPSRDRLTSFVAFSVDAARLREEFFPALLAPRAHAWPAPTGFPPLVVTLLDDHGRVVYPPGGTAPKTYVDEKEIPLVFLDRELFRLAATVDTSGARSPAAGVWRLRTGYGDQTIPEIIAARAAPIRAIMTALAVALALGVFFVARAAAREVRLAEMKANFVSSVSHDLKTPLALIQLFAETLELGRLKSSDRAQEYYRVINSEARKLTRRINNLLDFSKIEAGLREYKREPEDLEAITRRVLESLDSQFRQSRFTVTTAMAADVPPVLVDAEAVEQALENVLSNAIKYSPERREILVEVDAEDGYGRVRVTDHGIGIPPRLQRQIFRKFYRVQTDAGKGAQGTGLGLAIVDHIVRALGGFVTVESELGRGSTFTLHFPAYRGEVHGSETDTRDRGRTADVARSA